MILRVVYRYQLRRLRSRKRKDKLKCKTTTSKNTPPQSNHLVISPNIPEPVCIMEVLVTKRKSNIESDVIYY